MVNEAVRKSAVLIEALPYIRLFRDRVVVVKLGGSAQEDPEVLARVLTDIDFMISVGMRPLVVYGGGKRISRAMEKAGKTARFVHGQRVTDPETMEIVARVLIDEIGADLCAVMERSGGLASLLNGRDHGFLSARKKHLPKFPEVDLQCVGEPSGVDAAQAEVLFARRMVPFVAPVARAADAPPREAALYNVNGDTASAFIAVALQAAKIVFLSDTPGIFRTLGEPETLLSSLRCEDVEILIEKGILSGGMIPKVEASVRALEGGVSKAHIVSGYQPHALLLEIFTDKGAGTEIVR
ncbi:MAG: acetylglutamate kinase [Planctomycetota bacterium]